MGFDANRPDLLIGDIFRTAARAAPRRVAAWRGDESLTFEELDRRGNQAARALRTLGVGHRDHVIAWNDTTLDVLPLFVGTAKLGAVFVPISPLLSREEGASVIDAARPKLIAADDARAESAAAVADTFPVPCVGLAGLGAANDDTDVAEPLLRETDPHVVFFTSGSTGPPKGAVYTHGNFSAQVEMLKEVYGIQPGEIDLPTFPLFALFAPALGMTSVLPEMDFTRPGRVDPTVIIEAIESFGVTTMFGSPALLDRVGRPIVLISDEPYRTLVFDDVIPPQVPPLVTRTVIATSWSKSLAIPGERIGYLAFSPRMPEAAALFEACTFTSRVLGFVNAPALWQWVVAEVGDQVIDVAPYREKRDLMYEGLVRIGYQCVKPQGAFYVFPRTPIDDDVAFVRRLAEEGVLTVPGSGFGAPGHMRISLTVERDTIVRALPGFERAFHAARG